MGEGGCWGRATPCCCCLGRIHSGPKCIAVVDIFQSVMGGMKSVQGELEKIKFFLQQQLNYTWKNIWPTFPHIHLWHAPVRLMTGSTKRTFEDKISYSIYASINLYSPRRRWESCDHHQQNNTINYSSHLPCNLRAIGMMYTTRNTSPNSRQIAETT